MNKLLLAGLGIAVYLAYENNKAMASNNANITSEIQKGTYTGSNLDPIQIAPTVEYLDTELVSLPGVDNTYKLPVVDLVNSKTILNIDENAIPTISVLDVSKTVGYNGSLIETITLQPGSYSGPYVIKKDNQIHTYVVNGSRFVYTGSQFHSFGFVNTQDGQLFEIYLNSIYGKYNNNDLYDYAGAASAYLLAYLSTLKYYRLKEFTNRADWLKMTVY